MFKEDTAKQYQNFGQTQPVLTDGKFRDPMTWNELTEVVNTCLQALTVTDLDGRDMSPEEGFDYICELTEAIRKNKNSIFMIGNGASASMASHVAADLAKNAHLHTEVFSDLALITAIANDLCYEQVFAEPLRRRMNSGDMVVAISSSGESRNILAAVKEAKKLGGTVVTLSAMKGNNSLREAGEVNFYVPASTYGLAESCHAVILHHWIDQLVQPIE